MRKTYTYQELIKQNLTGYEFCMSVERYTRTGWGLERDYYVVIEDDGIYCKVKHKESGTITESHKTIIARRIEENPVLMLNKEENVYINKKHTIF